MSTVPSISGLRDNQTRGTVADFLRGAILPKSQLSFVSAYFTVHAYFALRETLENAGPLRFLFGEPSFVSLVDADKADSKHFRLTETGLTIGNAMHQRPQARACADCIRKQVDIRSVVRSRFLHGKMYHVLPENGNAAQAILGSSNFTMPGLGLSPAGNNTELNIILDSTRDRDDLLAWFNQLWKDKSQVADVKDEVLKHLERLYGNQSPQFVYYLTHLHQTLSAPSHPIRNRLLHPTADSPDHLAIIKQDGRV
jgi:phosphatidylserine/phosphatidylglycerophosphate/cardiolipin synthase-like enzyme